MICRKIKRLRSRSLIPPRPHAATVQLGQPSPAMLTQPPPTPSGAFSRFLLHFSFGGGWMAGMTLYLADPSQDLGDRAGQWCLSLPAGSSQDAWSFPSLRRGREKGPNPPEEHFG